MNWGRILLAAASLAVLAAGQSGQSATGAPETRRAFFGELHLHTGYSFDAYALMGSRAEPDQAYRFGRGEPVTYMGKTLRRSRPIDFMAVTDHSEYLGSFKQLENPQSALAQTRLGKLMMSDPVKAALGGLVKLMDAHTSQLMQQAMASAWAKEVEAANANYRPGSFTTFVAYEWTTMKDLKYNLHRNVIFRDKPPEAPFTAVDSTRPEDLWAFLERERAKGIEALAIPHNSNASGGLMFDWNDSDGRPISEAYAQHRALNEPLVEIFQNKGQSETVPLLSPEDGFANFEVAEDLLTFGHSDVHGSYAREALGRGLIIASRVGANPFKFGFVGASDFHNGMSDSAESAYAGQGLFSTDPHANLPDRAFARTILSQDVNKVVDPAKMMAEASKIDVAHTPGKLNWSSAGLTGVWAEENTRPAIYAALRRKETFATSGTELRLRFFGGWNYPAHLQSRADWVKAAYRQGVPMGGDLPALAHVRHAPTFLLQAAKDPDGANLDRVQVIKIWLDGNTYREKVFDVAWSSERRLDPKKDRVPAVRNTVDLKTATYSNSVGAAVLKAQWRDPEFDPTRPAVYYARALEIPTPRWTTLLAAARDLPLPKGVPATIQERAISSPIWYTPPNWR